MSALRKDLRAIAADGAASAMMAGVGETYLPPFVLAITGSELACGLSGSIPVVLGALLALVSPYALRRWRSYRGWVGLCALVQAAAFLPLVAGALWGAMPLALLFVFISLYWGSGQAAGASWAAWVETLMPNRCRTRYFAWRTRLCQAATLAGFLVGGLLLGTGSGHNYFFAFAMLFAIAAASRLASARCIAGQSEPVGPGNEPRLPGLKELRMLVSEHGAGRIFCYLLAVQLAVQISGPFFAPYMLSKLAFSYAQYMLLMCAFFLGKIVCAPALGQLANRFGTRRLLWVGGISTIPCSALWLASDSFGYLFMLQFYSGAAWAAYELAVLLLGFEAIPRHKRVGLLTIYNLSNAVSLAAGSLLGGAILFFLAETREAYLLLMVISTVARTGALLMLVRMPETVMEGLATAVRGATLSKAATAVQPALASHAAGRLAGPHRDRQMQPRPHEARSAAAPLGELPPLPLPLGEETVAP